MAKTPDRILSALAEDGETAWPLYPLIEAGRSIVEDVLSHVMDASTAETPAPPSLPQLLPVTLPTLPLPLIRDLRTPSPQCCSPGVRPMTRSYSTDKKADFHGRKWFEDHCGVKLKHQWSSSIMKMVPKEYHLQSDCTWMRGGEDSLPSGLLTSPLPSQYNHPYDTLHLPKVG